MIDLTQFDGHTPGEWRFDKGRDQVIAANGSLLCKVATGEDRKEEDANARLIAAAPQLLAEVRALRAVLKGLADSCESVRLSTIGDGYAMLKAVANDARKAIS